MGTMVNKVETDWSQIEVTVTDICKYSPNSNLPLSFLMLLGGCGDSGPALSREKQKKINKLFFFNIKKKKII